jgi:hypothetical protein
MEFPSRKAILSLLFAGSVFLSAASALKLGGTGEIEMRGFRTDGVSTLQKTEDEGGRGGTEDVSWEIRGAKALVSQDSCRISGFAMKVSSPEQGVYHITSPQCEFNTASRAVRSNSALNIDGAGLSVSGNGYDLYWSDGENRFTIVIRDAVRITMDRLAMPDKKELRKK